MAEMHTGSYSPLNEPILNIEVALSDGNRRTLNLLLDTGVNVDFSLTYKLATELKWQLAEGIEDAGMANESQAKVKRARGYVYWMGQLTQFDGIVFMDEEIKDASEKKSRRPSSTGLILDGSLGMGKLKLTEIFFGQGLFTISKREG
jgi:predicted aspartyl protease